MWTPRSPLAQVLDNQSHTILGVVGCNGEPVIEGVADVKLTLDHLYTAAGLCSPTLEITDPAEVQVKGRLILAVSIPAG